MDQYYRKKQSKLTLGEWFKRFLREKKVRWTLIVAVPVFGFMTFSNKGILQRIHLMNQKHEMEVKVREAQEEQRRLQQQLKALESDKKAIEKVAREKYGMVREGETVYKVKKEK
jgi:cell division protein FtsB